MSAPKFYGLSCPSCPYTAVSRTPPAVRGKLHCPDCLMERAVTVELIGGEAPAPRVVPVKGGKPVLKCDNCGQVGTIDARAGKSHWRITKDRHGRSLRADICGTWKLAALLLLAFALNACGGGELSPRGAAPSLTVAQAAGVGKRCGTDFDCDSALVCTDRLAWPGRSECAYAVADVLDCPTGYTPAVTLDAKVGVPVVLDGSKLTGHFCIPPCTTADDCGHGQCCIGFAHAPGGACGTVNPRNSYAVPVWCSE